eukprot:gene4812-biopygen34359
MAAGGGAGLQDRSNSGQAEGGRAEAGDPNTEATGGSSGGGAGYRLDGSGGGTIARSFLTTAMGGRDSAHYGGFGGGGGPYNGGGGGGGYDGGDCSIGGTDHDCYGGSSWAADGGQATANVNEGDGYVIISCSTQLTPGLSYFGSTSGSSRHATALRRQGTVAAAARAMPSTSISHGTRIAVCAAALAGIAFGVAVQYRRRAASDDGRHLQLCDEDPGRADDTTPTVHV